MNPDRWNGNNHQYNVINVFMCIQALCYCSTPLLFSGWKDSGMGNFPVPLAKDMKNKERRSLAGYEHAEKADPTWMTLLLYLG